MENFCMSCGARLIRRRHEGKVRPLCEKCGWVYFKNPACASAVAIVMDGKLVLVKRGVPPHTGSWCLPSGFGEYDESPEETAVREVKEETNLDIRLLGLYKTYFSDSCPGKNTVVHVYLAEAVGGEMAPGDDATDVRAFPLDDLPAKIAFRAHLEIVTQIRKRERKSSLSAGVIRPERAQ